MRTIDPIERQRLWEEVKDCSRQLGVCAPPRLDIGLKVERDGCVLSQQREEGHSWVRNAWNGFWGHMTRSPGSGGSPLGPGVMGINTNGGTTRSSTDRYTSIRYIADNNYGFRANPGYLLAGIVVGTSDSAFSVENYNLGAAVAHGSGAGQLLYNTSVVGLPSYDGGVWTVELSRKLNNASGGEITIKEVALYWGTNGSSDYSWFVYLAGTYFILARDVLGSPVAVPYGAQLTVTYDISMDFSSIDT